MPPQIPLADVTIAQLLAWLVALGVLIGGLRWIAPILSALHAMAEDWAGTEERPGVPARLGVMERLQCFDERLTTIEEDSSQAAFHSQPNHGTSSYDALVRKIDGLADRLPPK